QLAPAALAQDVGMLAGQDHERLVETAEIGRAEIAEGIREAAEQRLRLCGELVVDLGEAVGGVDGDGALLGAVAALDVKRLPRVLRLVLGEAERVLPGIA